MTSLLPRNTRIAATLAGSAFLWSAVLGTGALAVDGAQLDLSGAAGPLVALPRAVDLPPVMPALAAALDRETPAGMFYAARAHAPIWAADAGVPASERALALVEVLERADDHALPVARYRIAELRDHLSRPWSAAAEEAFTSVFLDYARDVSSGVLEPRRISRNIDVRPVRPDAFLLLQEMASTPNPVAMLERLAPSDADYSRLLRHYAELRAIADRPETWGPQVAAGPTLREGDRGARVAALRARLRALGDYPVGPVEEAEAPVVMAANEVTSDVALDTGAPDANRFDPALTAGVIAFQRRHGLNEDGVVGPVTLEALNATPALRAKQIAVNLERARWLNGRLEGKRIVANLPDFRVEMIGHDGSVIFDSRVVIGKYRHQTVEFSDEMDHMVVNPTWFVPMSIATQEILPKLQEDPTYLERKNMRLVGADASFVDWTTVTPATFPGRVRQAPGEQNALGQVKFMFPNDHAIYLHDTPQRSLFRRDNRAFSHGCVRVEKPNEFAKVLLSAQEADPAAAYERWLRSGRERYVELDEKVPVHLIYRTTWIDDAGVAQYRGDVYKRDLMVARALETAGVDVAGF